MKSKLQRELFLGWKARAEMLGANFDYEDDHGTTTNLKRINRRLHQGKSLKNPYEKDCITKYEVAEKKLQLFKTVLETIVNCADVMDPEYIATLARKALEETFCEICGTHSAKC
jgi:hypothetical protein